MHVPLGYVRQIHIWATAYEITLKYAIGVPSYAQKHDIFQFNLRLFENSTLAQVKSLLFFHISLYKMQG